MAYTYKDFLGAASGSNMLGRFSDDDLRITQSKPEYGLAMLGLYKDYDGATTPDAQLLAQTAMEQLRSSYGVDAGKVGAVRLATPYNDNLMQPSATKPGFSAVNLSGNASTPGSVPGQDSTVTPSGGNVQQSGATGSVQQQNPGTSSLSGEDQAYQEILDAAAKGGNFTYGNEAGYQDSLGKVTGYGDFTYDRADQQDAALDALLNQGGFTYANETQRQAAINALLNQKGFTFANEEQRQAALNAMLNQEPFAYGNSQALQDALLKATNPETFAYENEAAYQQLLQQMANREGFSYNPASDPSWQAYLKAFRREGDRATANALAQASAATGGVPSSYAAGAAQQAGAYYASQAADMLPTLYQQAYERYLNEQGLNMQALEVLRADRSDQYGIHQDNYQKDLNAYELLSADEKLAYDRWVDAYERNAINYETLSAEEQVQYQRYLDIYNMNAAKLDVLNADADIAYQRWLDEFNLKMANYETLTADEQNEYQKWLDKYEQYVANHQLISADKEMSFERWLYEQELANVGKSEATDEETGGESGAGDGGGESGDIGEYWAGDLTWLQDAYKDTNGVISDPTVWEMLLDDYTEEQLKTAGFAYSDGSGDASDEQPGEDDLPEVADNEDGKVPLGGGMFAPQEDYNLGELVDAESLRALGYENITKAELGALLDSGEIEGYMEGGKLRFRKKQEETNPISKGGASGPVKPERVQFGS